MLQLLQLLLLLSSPAAFGVTYSVFTGFEYKAPHEVQMPEAEEML